MSDVSTCLSEVCCACFPANELAALAELRCVPGVRVALAGEQAWVRWQAGDERVLRRVLPIRGSELYFSRDNRWYPLGHHLPAFAFPADLKYRPLCEVLTPAPVQPVPAPGGNSGPFPLGLAADNSPRPTTAIACDLPALARWAENIAAPRLAKLYAAHRDGRILLLGERLPLLPSSDRFWGQRVLVLLGCRLDPPLPEIFVKQALGLADDELLLMRAEKSEVLSRSMFAPLTRAGLRLATASGGRSSPEGEARR